MPKEVLLCPPTQYDVVYQINPWMDTTNKVNPDKAMEQYNNLKQTYLDLGVTVNEISQQEGLPDMVYAANFGFPQDNIFVKANFMHDERKGEAELAKNYFAEKGFTVKELPENVIWEGQGDLLAVGDKYFLGWGKRSDKEAKDYLSEFLGHEMIDIKLTDPYYYHLDTCFTPLDAQTAAVNPRSFEEEGLATIKKHFPNIIEVGEEDNNLLACNAVIVDKTVVVGQGISQKLKDDYAKYGFTAREVPTSEYLKGGGSVKCLTLEYY